MARRKTPQALRALPRLAAPLAPAAGTPSGGADLDARVVLALSGIAAGDPSALYALYSLMGAPMYSLLLRVTGTPEAAGDAMVTAFLHVWRTRAFRPAGAGAAWMMDLACATARAPLAPAG